jgi:hypothetical protein
MIGRKLTIEQKDDPFMANILEKILSSIAYWILMMNGI